MVAAASVSAAVMFGLCCFKIGTARENNPAPESFEGFCYLALGNVGIVSALEKLWTM